ncbi:MAG: arginase family protein [Bacteroidales bacterium]|nr:arginase family protein [Bacteroidales bacterium]
MRKEEGALYVFFEQGESRLKRSFRENGRNRDNGPMLDEIIGITARIMEDTTSRVTRIQIVGLASVEGGVQPSRIFCKFDAMNILLDISGAYGAEGWDDRIRQQPESAVLNLRTLTGCQCYCSPEAEAAIRQAIAPYPAAGIHWIDTGDYHYISKLWMEKITVPFALVLLDHHPDDQPDAFGSGLLSCGGWVKSARQQLPLLQAVRWNATDVPDGLPVYLSIDLDLLSPAYAVTNWDQGSVSLPDLLACIRGLQAHRRILGCDICGGITPAQGGTSCAYAGNRNTRERLLEIL